MSVGSSLPMNRLAYEGVILVPMKLEKVISVEFKDVVL